jgi:ATP-binding cassette subfamily B protein
MTKHPPVLLRLLRYAKPYWRTLMIAGFCIAGQAVFVFLLPVLIGRAIDVGLDVKDGVATGDKQTLVLYGLGIVGVSVFRGVFAYGQTYFGEWISQRVAYDIRNDIYNHLQRLSFAYHDKAQTGQLMSRATQDVEGVRFFISMGLLRLMYIAVLLVGCLALMFYWSWQLALIASAFIPIVAFRSAQVTLSLRPIWLAVQDLQGRIGTVLQENLSGMRVVKAFAREQHESVKFSKEAKELFEKGYESNRIQALNTPLMTSIWMLSMVCVTWVGAWQISEGYLTTGELTTFVFFLTMLQLPVRSLGWIVMLFARAQSAGERIYEILDAESAVQEKPGAPVLADVTGHVRFEDVAFAYDAISPVLRRVDIDAHPGEVVALLGPTGSGKTTVVNLMPRFYDVTGGSITIDGKDIRDVTLASLRESIGIVQQDLFLFSATIRENIAYGAVDASQEQIEQAARTARIHDFIMSTPEGYDTWVGERGVTLSGGQRQRVAIARTLLKDPRILIFDDSTSSVDTETEYLIQQALAELMKGRTTFVIAQRLRTVKAADQILVLQGGQVVERGRHEELIEEDGLYRQIYDLELRDQEEAFQKAHQEEREAVPSPAGGAS